MNESCATCSRFLKCTVPSKGVSICRSYAPWTDKQMEILTGLIGKNIELDEEMIALDVAAEQSFQTRMNDALSPNNAITPDLKIDDRDLKEYPNFYEFCMDPQGLDQPPLARQLIIFTHLFSEWCPFCSHEIFHTLEAFPVDYPVADAKEHVTFLEYGICPKCKRRKSDMINDGDLNNYIELALACGQRCVVGNTLIHTSDGMVEIGEYARNRNYGFTPFFKPIATRNGVLTTSQFYRARKERPYRIKLYGDHTLMGTGDHPVMTDRGFKKLSDITDSDYVQVRYGHNVFGSNVPSLWELTVKTEQTLNQRDLSQNSLGRQKGKECKRPACLPGSSKSRVKFLTEDICRMMGFWVSEGHKLHITNFDEDVIALCESVFHDLFSGLVYRNEQGVGLKDWLWIREWMSNLMGQDTFNTRSATKEMPEIIRKAPKQFVVAFLQALWEGDGGVNSGVIDYTTISPKLARQLHSMMLNIGVPCRLRKFYSWATNGSENQVSKPTWVVRVTGDYAVRTFNSEIGFLSKRKRRAAEKLQAEQKNMPAYYEKLTPHQHRKGIKLIRKANAALINFNQRSIGIAGSGKHLSVVSMFDRDDNWARISDKFNLSKLRMRTVLTVFKEWSPFFTTEFNGEVEAFLKEITDTCYYEKVSSIKHLRKPVETFDVTVPNNHTFVSNGILSHNSGKSIGTSLASGYVAHKYLKLQDPTKVFKLTKNTTLAGTFVALTFMKAKSLLFEPMVDLMAESPWFRQYHELLDDYAERYSDDAVYTFGKEVVIYKHRKFKMYPASPSKRILRGDSRLLSVIDELGWFPFGEDSNDRERAGANEVYTALDRSMLTVRGAARKRLQAGFDNIPTAYGIYASSPSAYNDKIMSLVRAFSGSDIGLAAHFATWEMNPEVPRNEPSIQKAYLEDPVAADRDYGAQPPLADSAFISDVTEFQDNFTGRPNLLGKYSYTVVTRKSGMERRSAKFNEPFKVVKGPCVLGIDAGSSNNSFGITLARLDPAFKRPQILGMMEIAPDHRKPLDHAYIYKNVILPIVKAYQVVRVYVDRWQSLKIIQDIEMDTKDIGYEVQGIEYSMRMNDFEFILDFMRDPEYTPMFPKIEHDWQTVFTRNTDGYPHCFKNQPVSHFLFQMATVRSTRKNVDKGQGYTDDVFRSAMLCLTNLYDDEVVEELKAYKFEKSSSPPRALIASVGYSTGGPSSSMQSSGGSIGSKSIVVGQRATFTR